MFNKKPKAIVVFNGCRIDFNQVSDILSHTWSKLEEIGLNTIKIKLLYSIITEMLENVYRYSIENDTDSELIHFSIYEIKSKQFQITTTNPVALSQYEKLKSKIEFVNSLNQIGLKKYYQYEIIKTKDNIEKGAGLGLIIISRKIEQPIKIEMQQLKEEIILVTLTVVVKL
jgi:hypothetical protein